MASLLLCAEREAQAETLPAELREEPLAAQNGALDFLVARPTLSHSVAGVGMNPHQRRSTRSFLISAMALAGFKFFGQVLVQFRIVWQR
jgi:hypothetical protein